MKYIIEDWMSNHVFKDKSFDSYQDARDFINEYANDEALKKYPYDNDAYCVEVDGICEDLYAVEGGL